MESSIILAPVRSLFLLFIVSTIFRTGIPVAWGQTNENKNAIYGTAGITPVYGAISINYERWLLNFNHNPNRHLTARVAYGYWADWGGDGSIHLLNFNWLSGKYKNFFDLGLGAVLLESNYSDPGDRLTPSANFGYRYLSKHFLFRTGLSWPEALYFSLGITF